MFGSFRVAPLLYTRDAQAKETADENTVSDVARCALLSKFSKLRVPPSIVTYAPLDGLVTSHLSTSCVQDYMRRCAVPRSSPMLQVTMHQGHGTFAGEPDRTHSPVTELKYRQTLRDAVDSSTLPEVELEHVTRPVFASGTTNQDTVCSLQCTEGVTPEKAEVDADLNTPMSGMEDDNFPLSVRKPGHDIDKTSDGTPPQAFGTINTDQIELACSSLQTATELHASAHIRHQPPSSWVPPSRDPPSSLPLQAANMSDLPQSGIMSRSPLSRQHFDPHSGRGASALQQAAKKSCAPNRAPKTHAGPPHVGGSGSKKKAENLSRQEKNRHAAARSNERRRRALAIIKHDFAKAQAEIRALMDREAEAKNLNRKLKDEAARRWMKEVTVDRK